MITAGINELTFEPKMPVNMDAIATTTTPAGMQPIQGPLVNLRYKPTRFRYNVRLSAAPTVGTVAIELKAGAVVLKTISLALDGVTQLDGQASVSLADVEGETPLSVSLVVSAALDAGITATVDSVLSCEIPLTTSGNC